MVAMANWLACDWGVPFKPAIEDDGSGFDVS
jgi:hypothetical protein